MYSERPIVSRVSVPGGGGGGGIMGSRQWQDGTPQMRQEAGDPRMSASCRFLHVTAMSYIR